MNLLYYNMENPKDLRYDGAGQLAGTIQVYLCSSFMILP